MSPSSMVRKAVTPPKFAVGSLLESKEKVTTVIGVAATPSIIQSIILIE